MRTDEDLLKRSHDDDAFMELFNRHVRTALRFSAGIVKNSSDAEDLVQEAFLALWTKRRSVVLFDGSALPWLLTTCKLLARNHMRKRDNRNLSLTVEAMEPLLRPVAAGSEDTDDLQDVLQDIDSLSPIEREAIVLCVINEVPYAEAAAQLGVSRSSIAKRIERARRSLRVAREERASESA